MSTLPAGGPGPGADPGVGHVPADSGAPTESLVSATVGDRCVNCSAPLSSDQRYCVVCGERRGAPRFTLPVTPATETAGATPPPARAPRGGGGRFSTGTTLIAGVATLLLALLVGVLIGHNPTPKTVAAAPVRIVTVGGGGSATPAASTPASGSGSTAAGSASAKSGKGTGRTSGKTPKAKKQTAAVKKQAAKKEASAASKVLGGKSTPPPTVTVGAKGSGKGYNKKTHKFTGSFFGQ